MTKNYGTSSVNQPIEQKNLWRFSSPPPNTNRSCFYSIRFRTEKIQSSYQDINRDSVKKILCSTLPDIIGITCTTSTYPAAILLAQLIKEINDIPIVFGGVHPTVMPEECLKNPYIDFIVRNEGEETFPELLSNIENKKSLYNIAGIGFKNDKSIITPSRNFIKDLDTLPFPAYHLFKEKYIFPNSLYSSVLPLITARGCIENCKYCCVRKIFGKEYRAHSAEFVVEEIEFLVRNFHIRELHIWDDNFTFDRERLIKICKYLRRKNIKVKFAIPNGLRPDYIDEEIIKLLKEMGVYWIGIGVESGNQQTLDKVARGVKIEQIRTAFNLARKYGIETWGYFIIGFPNESREEIINTINFAKELNPTVAKFHILKPYPGTEIYNQFSVRKYIIDFDYANWGVHTKPVYFLPQLSKEEILFLQKKAYRMFFLKLNKVIQLILNIRSFNRLKSSIKLFIPFVKKIS